MKTEQEQIEEMAQCMCGSKKECIKFYNEEHPCVNNGMCKNIQAAEIFYNAGYRKASDVIDEFVERLKEENEISFRRYGKGIGISTIFRIADEMRQEVEKE